MVQPLGPVKTFYKGVSSREKSSFVYGRGYHQLYNDVNAEQEVFTKII